MDQVAQTRSALTITKHGKPIARLVPIEETTRPLFGLLAGSAEIHGDLLAPLDEVWEAEH